MSEFINNNREYLVEALTNGIDSNTVTETLDRLASIDNPPSQVRKVVETIARMKSSKQTTLDERYLSQLVKNNSKKIESALNEGISKDEIAETLMESFNVKAKENDIKFVVSLITGMKRRELVFRKSSNKQFILKNDK